MTKKNPKFYLLTIAFILLVSQSANSQESYSIEITTAEKRVEYGMPIVVSLKLVYQQPRTWRQTGKPRLLIHVDGLKLLVQNLSTDQTFDFILFNPDFYLEGTKGLEYNAKVVVWCDVHKERKRRMKKMIFPSPSNYRIRVEREDIRSNELEIVVKPSQLGQRAMSLLKDPNDLAFLRGGTYKSERAVSNLKEVIKQCKDSVLAKWAAARLGIVYFEEFNKKHPSFDKFKAMREKGEIEEPLFDQAYEYLFMGTGLSDEYPIRDEVLGHLVEIEFINGDYDKIFSLIDELITKYPKMEHGRKATKWKQELLELQKQEKEKEQQPDTKD